MLKTKETRNMPAAIVHFEIQVTDTERAKRFYAEVFDWKIEKWEGTDFYGVWTGRSKYPNGSVVGLDGGLGVKEGETPAGDSALNSFLCTVEIQAIDDILQKVEKAGGAVIKPKYSFPHVGWMAICTDLDGNRFSLIQNDTTVR
jgi:predicted enzyme related to lactoylglutathione lyase